MSNEYPYQPKATDPKDPLKIMGEISLDESPGQALLKERELLKADPIAIIKGGYLRIKDKSGNLMSFRPNKVQATVLEAIQSRRRARLPVRIAILKGRQFGVSTLCQGVVYAFVTQRANTNGAVIADDQDGADYLAEMPRLFYENMIEEHKILTPRLTTDNGTMLEFRNKKSMIRIETAGKRKKVGRKFTFRVVHGSEVAFWPEFSEAHKSLSQSVPEKHETIVLYESTANGVNDFCKFWRTIKKLAAKGETNWIPLFLSWKDHEEYAKPFTDAQQLERFEQSMSAEEREIIKTHELSMQQLHWRRWKIQNDFNGSVEDFQVEYPLTDEEAFKSTGKAVFPERLLKPQRISLITPKLVGEVERVERRATFVPEKGGYLKIWEGPKPGHRYVIGADCSEAAASHDYACAQVIDRTTWRQVAVLHGRIAPDIYGEKLFALGAWYNWALIAPEVNGPGLVTTMKLRDLYYPNLIRRKKMVVTDAGALEETEEYGFHSNSKTKPLLVSGGVEALRNVLLTIHDEATIDELATYVVLAVKEEGSIKYGADVGFYDDRVMALLIAIQAAKDIPDGTTSASSQLLEQRTGRNKSTGY